MFNFRQFSFVGANGDVGTTEFSQPFYQSFDVNPNVKLKTDAGKNAGDVIYLAAAGSATVQLPINYDTANRLFLEILSEGICKIVVTSAEHSTSTALIKGESSARPGFYSTCQRVSTITLSNPTATGFNVQVSMFELPDLTDSDSYTMGPYAFNGVSV